ncbi:MAG: DUF5519 family protein [Candidatus Rokubacteria bacterium]|nr:DUF5519 family protein [Candidatus Rokubacteria bacterium]
MAGLLNEALGRWPGVRIAPMFGRWGYFTGATLFACFPLDPRQGDLWIRLTRADQSRALDLPGVVPHRRFGAQGWIEYRVDGPRDVGRALRLLRQGYRSTSATD